MHSIEAAWEHRDRVPLSDLFGLEDPKKRMRRFQLLLHPDKHVQTDPTLKVRIDACFSKLGEMWEVCYERVATPNERWRMMGVWREGGARAQVAGACKPPPSTSVRTSQPPLALACNIPWIPRIPASPHPPPPHTYRHSHQQS